MKAYADFNDYEIAGEYEGAGKSGRSIEGRLQFNQIMGDVKSGKGRQLCRSPDRVRCCATFFYFRRYFYML